ncbi:MAG TPA: extensin family protein, partial [Polyangiaceae bacterium]|nr:extensin family protein [Polyangiaceae bacterium]
AALVPYLVGARWAGKGPPPTDYSIFAVPLASPAPGYASLDRDTCEAELRDRHVDFARAEDTPGVRAPVRLRGPLHGVSIHSMLAPAARARSRAELVDCRLALSLDDFAATIVERGIVEVRTFSAYRTRAESGCTRKYDGEQHCAALAVDVGSFKRADGTVLDVERDFHGYIGALTCRNDARPAPETPAAHELWDIACSSAGRNFLVVLRPNWNSEHKNHLHLELTTHDWVLVR